MVGDGLDLGCPAGEDRRRGQPSGSLRPDRGRCAARDGGTAACGCTAGCCCTADRGRAAGRCGARSCGSRSCGSCTGRTRAGAGGARSCSCARAGRGTPAAACARGSPAAAAAEDAAELGEQGALDDEQRAGREDRGERLGVGAKLRAELVAGIAGLDVSASRPGDLGDALGRLGELEPNLVAGQLARLTRLGQGDAGPDEQGFDAGDGRIHRLGDLLVAHRVDFAEQQGRTLGLGKVADVGEQVAELLAVLDVLVGRHPVHMGMGVHGVLAVGGRLAKVVETAVPGDPIEPGLHRYRPLVGDHRVVGGHEDLLQNVLGVLGRAQHLAAEAEESRLVALDQRVEGVLVALAGQRDEVLVILEAEKGRAPGEKPASLCVCEC